MIVIAPLQERGITKPIFFLADSGGGALLHLSAAIAQLLSEDNDNLYVLASDLTPGLMPMDQQVHREEQAL